MSMSVHALYMLYRLAVIFVLVFSVNVTQQQQQQQHQQQKEINKYEK